MIIYRCIKEVKILYGQIVIYIAKNMLAAHLDLNNDAASRNLKTIKKTIRWIETKIPKKGRVLDLGCGPGLYSSLLFC